jgi:hypothetical protein
MQKNIESKIDKLKTENLVTGGSFTIENIPIKKFFDQAQYIDNELLPKIIKTRGIEHPDYIFFREVYKSLLYAVMVADRERNLVMRLQQINQIRSIQATRLDFCEKELLKYTTMEDLYFTDGLDKIAAGVAQRAADLLNKK